MADKDAYPRLLLADIRFRRELGPAGQAEALGVNAGGGRRGRAAGFHHRFGDVFWFPEGANGVNARPAGFQGIKLDGVAKTILIQLYTQAAAQLLHRRGDLHAHRQDHHVKAHLVLGAIFILVGDQ